MDKTIAFFVLNIWIYGRLFVVLQPTINSQKHIPISPKLAGKLM